MDLKVPVEVCKKQLSFLLKWLCLFLFPPAVNGPAIAGPRPRSMFVLVDSVLP